jgi:glycosyltransferase involved in cell wall biosynthesis
VHAAIARRLNKDRFAVFVATPRRCDDVMEWDDAPGVTVLRLALGTSVSERRGARGRGRAVLVNLQLLPTIVRLAARMRREGLRIIHTAVTPRDALAGVLLSHLTGAALVIHWHLSLDRDFAPGYYPLVWRWAFRRARAVLAVSEPSRRTLLPLGVPEAKTHILHNGVDLERFRPDLDGASFRAGSAIAPDVPMILLPGRLRPHKGQADLLRAAAELRDRGIVVTVVFVGRDDPAGAPGSSGPFRPQLERLCEELELTGQVLFLEHRSDMPEVLAAADVVTIPSHDDPLPLVVLEAMACGKPVVATRSGGIPEVVTHEWTGLLVPPGAPAALADEIQRLLSDEALRERLVRAARQHIEQNFSQESMARQAARHYERIVAGPSAEV